MTWFSYTLVAVFSFAIFYTLSRVFLKEKKSDPISYAIMFNLVCAILITLVSLIDGFVLPNIRSIAINLGLMTALYTISQVLIFKAAKIIPASDLIIFFSSRTLWAILAAIVFLGEDFSIYKVIGTVLILGAIIFVSTEGKIMITKGHLFTLLAAICIGVGFVNDSYILKQANALTYASLTFIFPTILTMFIFPTATLGLKKYMNTNFLIKIVLLSTFYSIGMVASYVAYQRGGDASQIVPIGQSVVIVTILFAALFLGERNNLVKKLIAAVLVSVGVVLMM